MTEQLENLIIHPETQAMDGTTGDLLSHVLAQMRLTGDRVFPLERADGESLELAPDAGYVCTVSHGALRLHDDGQEAVGIETGDLVMLTRDVERMQLVATGGRARLTVCRFRFDPASLRCMVRALPRHIHITRDEGKAWIPGILPFMLSETGDIQPGASLMISRLIDLVVIRTLRTWVHRGQTFGWMGGLSDERIGRVLIAIHESPAKKWSIDTLAVIAGMSRSSFCGHFAALVGRSPLRYQNEWRLTLAREMLSQRTARVGEIGLSIGYASEAAFSRAYKALFGNAPRDEYMASSRN